MGAQLAVKQEEKLPTVWVLHTDSAGELNARIGVAEKLVYPYEIVRVPLKEGENIQKLNIADRFDTIGYLKKRFGTQYQHADWPDIVITSGSKHSKIAYEIKRASGGKTFIVGMQNPKYYISQFDLIVQPNHMPPIAGDNVMQIVGVPHNVTAERLNQGSQLWHNEFAGLQKPIIAVLVGGDTEGSDASKFGVEQGHELGGQLREMAKKYNASLVLTNSHRTADDAWLALTDEVNRDGEVKARCYDSKNGGDNPYLGLLALADVIVVTGDSMSMCSEASATGKPTYIYAQADNTRSNDRKFHELLYTQNLARPFTGELTEWNFAPLDTSGQIAEEIKLRFQRTQQQLLKG